MNLQEEWNNMQLAFSKDANYNADIKKKSFTVYERLLQNLQIKLYWIILFCSLGILGALLTEGLLSYLLLGFGLLYMFGGLMLRVSLQRIRKAPDYNENTHSFMQNALESIEKILKIEHDLFLVTGPLMGPFGVLCSFLYTHGSFEAVIAKVDHFYYIMAAATLLIIPGYFLGEYLTKIGFGKDLDALKTNLKEMERKG